ncbi:MAG: hypothetical protein JXD19_12165 [Deltaproteobacteria bacterium]|nr:hypothetical protein [Deltaproteobacteria bacterium]
MRTMRLLLVVLFIVPLIACGRTPPREGIVGTWEAGNQRVEIKADGTMVFTDRMKEQPSTGSYRFVDDNHVQVTFADSSTKEFKVSVSSGSLKVTRPDGTVFAKYSRVK